MDLRTTFNEDAFNYDQYRPCYCPPLFEAIFKRISKSPCTVLEIGIGTGQATKPFLDAHCDVTAVELGDELTKFVRQKYQSYSNFNVFCSSFEEFDAKEESFDLIYSATAFHWIDEKVGYPKCLKLLKPNGIAAFFWNIPTAAQDDPDLFEAIQAIYQKYRPNPKPPTQTLHYLATEKALHHYGFKAVEVKIFQSQRILSASQYLALLNTYSDHRSLSSEIKIPFERDLKALIESAGTVTITDTMELYMGNK